MIKKNFWFWLAFLGVIFFAQNSLALNIDEEDDQLTTSQETLSKESKKNLLGYFDKEDFVDSLFIFGGVMIALSPSVLDKLPCDSATLKRCECYLKWLGAAAFLRGLVGNYASLKENNNEN